MNARLDRLDIPGAEASEARALDVSGLTNEELDGLVVSSESFVCSGT